jgi:hypothetical protein
MKKAHLCTEDNDSPTADRRPHLYGQQRLLANVVHEGKAEYVRSAVEYTLVYGRRSRMAVNLVILKENSLDMQDKTWEALTAMGKSSHGTACLNGGKQRTNFSKQERSYGRKKTPATTRGSMESIPIAMNGTFYTSVLAAR